MRYDKEKRKNQIIDILIKAVILFCLFNVCYSLYNILMWKKDGDDINRQLDNLADLANVSEIDNTEINEQNIDDIKNNDNTIEIIG